MRSFVLQMCDLWKLWKWIECLIIGYATFYTLNQQNVVVVAVRCMTESKVEHYMFAWPQTRIIRWTKEDQRNRFSNSLFSTKFFVLKEDQAGIILCMTLSSHVFCDRYFCRYAVHDNYPKLRHSGKSSFLLLHGSGQSGGGWTWKNVTIHVFLQQDNVGGHLCMTRSLF